MHELTENSSPIEREFYEYYRTPRGEVTPEGATPLTTTHPTLTSNVKFMNFYPFNDMESISPRPMLFVAGENAHSREFSEDAYKRAAEPKELYIVPGAGHVDLYDRTSLIRLINWIASSKKIFNRYLNKLYETPRLKKGTMFRFIFTNGSTSVWPSSFRTFMPFLVSLYSPAIITMEAPARATR